MGATSGPDAGECYVTEVDQTENRPRFRTFEKTSVGLQAAEAIRALIVSGELGPGDALPSERECAVMLGISRPSLREGIRTLSAMNVLESRHGGGTYVTSLDPSLLAQPIRFLLQIEPGALRHLFEVRRVLEVEAARLAARRISTEAIAEIEQLVEDAHRVIDQRDDYVQLDLAIHSKIIAATANPIYLSLYESIAVLSLPGRRTTASDPSVRDGAHRSHVLIAGALSRHEPDAAARAMRDHLAAIERAFKASVATTAETLRSPGRGRALSERREVPRNKS